MTVYTTYGPLRGCSGVKHRTRDAAEQAVKRDQGNCIRQGTRSDRRVAVVIESLLYEDEAGKEPILSPSEGQKPVRWRPLPVGARGVPARPRSGL